jgi:hypothetical protein
VSAPYSQDAFADEEDFDQRVSEVYEVFPEILRFEKGDSSTIPDKVQPTEAAVLVQSALRGIRDQLVAADFTVPQDLRGQTAANWIEDLAGQVDAVEAELEPIDVTGLAAYWRPDALTELHGGARELIVLGEGTRLLRTIRDALQEVQDPGAWGIAALDPFDEWSAMARSPYTMLRPDRPATWEGTRAERPATERAEPPARRERVRPSERRRQRRGASEGAPPPRETRTSGFTRGAAGQIPACATHAYLNDLADNWVELVFFLEDMRGRFLPDAESGELLNVRCLEALEKSVRAYLSAYVEAWGQAYGRKELQTLERLGDSASTWEQLAVQLGTSAKRRRVSDEFTPALSTILQVIPFANRFADGVRWDAEGWRESLSVSAWMEESIAEHWDTAANGYFAVSARFDSGGGGLIRPPWEVIAEDFERAWTELAEDLAANVRVPPRFTSDVDWNARPIRWGALERLQEEYGLGGERLSGQLVAFEHAAQELLSAYLTETLWGIQQHYLGDGNALDGWPYLPGDKYTRDGLNTVDFDSFIGFLVELHRAREAFRPLEEGLPAGAPGHSARAAFYAACEQWFDFLGLKNEPNPSPEDLSINIKTEDPLSPPLGRESVSDGCQHTARDLELDLGLVIGSEATAAGPGILRSACVRERQRAGGHQVEWAWDAKPGKTLTVALSSPLEDVRVPDNVKTLGIHSPLALCAYLQRYGVGHDQNKAWYVTHSFVHESSDGAQKTVGNKLVFRLKRALPGPIAKLTKVAGRTSPGR